MTAKVHMSRTLVCILAETRSHEITWSSFKQFVLDPLDADLMLCISTPKDYDYQNPFWKFAKFRCTVEEYSDWGEAFDQAQKTELGQRLHPPPPQLEDPAKNWGAVAWWN
ncbi:hypothetical protein DPM17_01640 [Polynucleobacter paneuropaeus]|nr:hypothetical protein DPM17_01640 [Polynucleobacter paneuropaeus]